MDERMSDSIRAATSRNVALLLKAMFDEKQQHIAELMGISPTTLSEMKGDVKFDRIGSLIAACKLKLVPIDAQTFDASHLAALRTLAGVGLQHITNHDAEADA